MANIEEDESREISSTVHGMLRNFLDTKYGQQAFKYKVEKATKKGDNYMGVVYRVSITSRNGNKHFESIILKVPPQSVEQRNQFFARAGFLRETLAYEENFEKIPDIFEQRQNDVQLNNYFESLKLNALDCVDNANDRAYWCKLKEFFNSGTFYNLLLRLLESSSSEPYSVICHGDCWINNIMFKQESGEIVDIRLIDWQIMRYSSPIIDLMYFVMSSTTREFRKQHFENILDNYYSSARKHIVRLGSDPEKIYSRPAFQSEIQKKGAIGLLFSMIVLPLLTTKSEDVPDLEKLSEKVSAGGSTDVMEAGFLGAKSTLFVERLRGIIMDTIDWKLI